jgi:ectoine hydroxylase-related dioxygenase (phytanoyl-CoA dioxygenase family)
MREHVAHFDEHGWVLVPSLVPREDVEAALPGLFRVYPTPEEVASGVATERTERYLGGGAGDTSRRFRGQQFTGLQEAPTGDAALDRLCVHHRILDLVDALLAPGPALLYQAETFAKYAGAGDYAQPLHVDETNHTLVPPRRDGRYRQVQLFLYLSDVTVARGATRVVSNTLTRDVPRSDLHFDRAGAVRFDEHEVAAEGPMGSVLAYSADTVHRGSAMTEPGAGRFFFNLAYRQADVSWNGALPWPRRGIEPAVRQWIQSLDARQLCAIGFPPPGHDYWDEETLAATAERYPGLDLSAFR